MRSRLTSGTILLVLLTACDTDIASMFSGESKPPAEPGAGVQVVGEQSSVHALGEHAAARDYKMSYSDVQQCQVEKYFQPPRGWVALGVLVSVEGSSAREVPINPFYASLEGTDGRNYESTLAGCRPALKARRIIAGDTAKGWISFHVPRSARKFILNYRPQVIGVGVEEVRFNVTW